MTQKTPEQNLDGLLSDYFKAQLKQPWPVAPATATSEPSVLVAARTATSETPRNQPAARDFNARSRYTLAASVALLLGTCWYFSNGFQPSANHSAPNPAESGMIGGAEASNPSALKGIRENNALNGKGRPAPTIKLP